MQDWTTADGNDCARTVVAIGKRLYQNDSQRRERMLKAIRRYEAGAYSQCDESPTAVTTGGPTDLQTTNGNAVRWNLCHSIVATAVAKIAGTQQPKVTCVATNASWRERRKGPKIGQFVGGIWACSQGQFSDSWALGNMIFRDCCLCGIGLAKVWADLENERVAHDRCFPWEVLADPNDARYGDPSQIWHVYPSNTALLIAQYPEHEDAIVNAPRWDTSGDAALNIFDRTWSSEDVVKPLRVFEWWLLPQGKTKGRHVVAVDGVCLFEEEWMRKSFPFAVLRYDPAFAGWGAGSLVDEVAPIDDEMNDIISRISRSVRLTSMGTIWVPDGSDVDESTIDNEDCKVYKFSGPEKPQYDSPSPFNPAHVQLISMHQQAAHDLSGVNRQTASAQKQAGIESGEAIRLVSAIQSERLSTAIRAYQQWYVDLARLDIACVRELSDEFPDFAVDWPGSGFLQSIDWSDIALDDDMFVLQLAPVPGIKDTPADRLQTAETLYAANHISQDALTAVRQSFDTPGELERAAAQHRIIEQYCEGWLDATDEELESGKRSLKIRRRRAAEGDDEQGTKWEFREVPLFTPPLRFMRLETALVQVADAYLQAEIDGAPDAIKLLFVRWIEMCSDEIDKKVARMKAAQAPPAGPPGAPAMPPPGAPPAQAMA